MSVSPKPRGKSRNLTAAIKNRIGAFSTGGKTVAATNAPPNQRRGASKSGGQDEMMAKRASAKLEEGDIKGAIRLLGPNDSLAPAEGTTPTKLCPLHPLAAPDRRPTPTTSISPLQASASGGRGAIMSFPNGSAGGRDELRPQH